MEKDQKNFQIAKMVQFIDHDAEIIEESIATLTEENYHIEKENLIHTGKMKIDQFYAKKIKVIEMEKATMISTGMNEAKLKILLCTDKHIKSVLADVHKELHKLRDNKIYYKEILKKLILQAMYKILEKKLNLILVSADKECVETMIDELKNEYLANTGIDVKINIENYSELPIEEIGGVMITANNWKLLVKNTLVERLLYLTQQCIPLIRSGLFGPNPTRTRSSI